MELARQMIAVAWCSDKNKHKEMDVDLAEDCAIILNKAMNEPRLGLATTGELIDEIKARCEIDGVLGYKTVDS